VQSYKEKRKSLKIPNKNLDFCLNYIIFAENFNQIIWQDRKKKQKKAVLSR
jgi:hypothetical protein